MERPRKLVLTDWTKADNALHYYFEGNKSKLAKQVGMSRTTVTNFFDEKPVRESEFRKLCGKLRLNWEAVSSVHPIDSSEAPIAFSKTPIAPSETPISHSETWNDSYSQQVQVLAFHCWIAIYANALSIWIEVCLEPVRKHCRQKILNQHSRMRLLSGEEIGVDQLYVDVWLLNRSPRTFQVSPNKLLESFDLRNDRLGLGDRIRRDPGLEVANTNPKLVIFGKPGSGKTTFLKHLAVDWCKGKFQPDLIAVLIELRQIRDEQWNLLDRIDKELELGNWNQITLLKQQIVDFEPQIVDLQKRITDLKKQEKQIENLLLIQKQQENQVKELKQQLEALPLQSFLKQGKILVLMDGLDEVPTNQLRRNVQNQLRQLAEDYPNSRLILTCRTQIIEAIPVGFASVEVADFSEEQVEQFVQNWFIANGKSSIEAEQQWKTFDKAVRNNLALKELARTPVLVSLMCLVLHDEGEIPTDKAWLYEKGIKLLLSKWNNAKQIDGWELGSETYRQLSIEQKADLLTEIAARKFENPKNFVLFQQEEIVTQITQFLRLTNPRDGGAVLKAIEAQHGLLIERADELWSFSHLTFQEYFTVQWLTQLPSEELAEKIANQQWQEAVKQIVKSQQPADRLVRLIKRSIDQSIANGSDLQKFLSWVLQKSECIQVNYKPVAIRAFYLDSARALDRERDRALDLDLDLDLDRTLARALAVNRTLNLDLALDLALDIAHTLTIAYPRTIALDLTRALALALAFELALTPTPNSGLVNELELLRTRLPALPMSFQPWWQAHGMEWSNQLRQIMIEHHNIGHDWQFTDAQTQQLQRYYDANKFLIDLIKIEGAVSDSVRDEIEDRLLLPWEELQRRQS